jgi:transcriptional regulator with XRE-family HTH domain
MNRIRQVLKKQYRTQKYLVDMTGLSPATISLYCSNIQQPKLDVLEKIANLLDVDVRELIEPSKKIN